MWCFPGNVHIIFMCTANGCKSYAYQAILQLRLAFGTVCLQRFKKLHVNHSAALNLAAAVMICSRRIFLPHNYGFYLTCANLILK